MPRSSSAAPRSATPSKLSSNRPECQCSSDTVNGPRTAGSVASTDPTANRSSGESVRTSTVTSPWTPCGRPIRPTTSCNRDPPSGSVSVDHIDPDTTTADTGHHLAQRLGCAAVAPDDLAQVIRMHAYLQP